MSFLIRHLTKEKIRNSYSATTKVQERTLMSFKIVDENEQLNDTFMFYDRMNQQSSMQQSLMNCDTIK
jgi:hypothetical protein